MHGNFDVKWQSGITYSGPLDNNKLSGVGVMSFPDGYNIEEI